MLANLNSEYVPKLVEHLNTQIVNHKRYSTVASIPNQIDEFNIVTRFDDNTYFISIYILSLSAWNGAMVKFFREIENGLPIQLASLTFMHPL